MIATSRKRGYREERIIATTVVNSNSHINSTGVSSHVAIGVTPNARMNPNTTTRLSRRLNALVNTTASGITSRGN